MSRQILSQTSPLPALHHKARFPYKSPRRSSVRTRCRARRGPAPGASAATREVVRVRWLDTCWEGGGVSAGPVAGGVEPHCTRSSASTSRYRRGAASRLGGDERASSQKPTPHVRPTRNVAKTGFLPSWCRRQDWCAPMRHIWAKWISSVIPPTLPVAPWPPTGRPCQSPP